MILSGLNGIALPLSMSARASDVMPDADNNVVTHNKIGLDLKTISMLPIL